MFKKITFAAFAIAAIATSTQMASAQPGIANIANPTAAASGAASGIIKVGRRGARLGWRHRRHWRHHYVYHGPSCYWFLRKYHRTGNPYWKRKFYICKY